MKYINWLGIGVTAVLLACTAKTDPDQAGKPDDKPSDEKPAVWKIENGKFYRDGEWVFLKIAKPLRNFADANAVQQLINDLDKLKSKQYNTIEINCYWHHFDHDGDGNPDVSLEPLNRLINTIYSKGMMPCLSVETYAVGGGQMPAGFWDRFPDADAINDQGKTVTDTEYGFGSRVVSIFHDGYRDAARTFIKTLTAGVDHEKVLYFETTVEPQYMGTINLCFSTHAKRAYTAWLAENGVTDSGASMPATFPIPQSFLDNSHWNKFRAQFLADWVNGDAAAFREIAGEDAYIAVDYLDAEESTMARRMGIPEEFLAHLHAPNIIQVNWSWFFPTNQPNQKAYDRVHHANQAYNRDWAITEHMTFNGSDFNHFSDDELRRILQNTLTQGTRFGWEFVSIDNATNGSFSLYNDDWSPKRVMGIVDLHWDEWLKHIGNADVR
jgi:hypothetical protein